MYIIATKRGNEWKQLYPPIVDHNRAFMLAREWSKVNMTRKAFVFSTKVERTYEASVNVKEEHH